MTASIALIPLRMKCIKCSKEQDEPFLYDDIPICVECMKCTICTKAISLPEIQFCISFNQPMRHSRCSLAKGLHQAETQVSLESVERLNLARLLVLPDLGLTESSNIKLALNAQQQLFNMMTLEEKSFHTTMLEAVYGAAFTLTRKTSDFKSIREASKLRDAEKFKEALALREQPSTIPKKPTKESQKIQLTPREKEVMSRQNKFWKKQNEIGVDEETAKAVWEMKNPKDPWVPKGT